jgi:hypothetical protein
VGLALGRSRPTPQVVELVARAFDLPPHEFIEWSLWQVQELFDPERSDGFEAAVAQLFAFLDDAQPDVREVDKGEARESRRDIFALRRLAELGWSSDQRCGCRSLADRAAVSWAPSERPRLSSSLVVRQRVGCSRNAVAAARRLVTPSASSPGTRP